VNALSLYHDLKARGVILKAQGECLKVDAPADELTDEDKTALKEFKPRLLKFLSRSGASCGLSTERESMARWAGAHKDT
jgi:TubC N-terminal docking domain